MRAYRHLFHAGNFADVFKHALLARLLIALGQKDKPFFYLDTHAGTARYDLSRPWAQKNREHDSGIALVFARKDIPDSVAPYLAMVRADNRDGRLRYYPGSPAIALAHLRERDRMALTELNEDDCAALKQRFAADKRVNAQCMDGYQALRAFLPPAERRGLVLLDSSFDRAQEFARVADALAQAHKRWASGMYAVWYPLMEPATMRAFERRVSASGVRKILQLELSVHGEAWTFSLRGCGMLVVNPPWHFDLEAERMLDWLWRALSPSGEGGTSVRWLVPE